METFRPCPGKCAMLYDRHHSLLTHFIIKSINLQQKWFSIVYEVCLEAFASYGPQLPTFFLSLFSAEFNQDDDLKVYAFMQFIR